ncbi:unnamed protein product, partial [marine sediment metagenome]
MRNLRLTILCALFFSAITAVASAQTGYDNYNTASSYLNAGKYNEAIEYYKMALVKIPELELKAKTFNQLSYCHRSLKQYDLAIKTAQLGLKIPSKYKSALYYNLGQAYQGKEL